MWYTKADILFVLKKCRLLGYPAAYALLFYELLYVHRLDVSVQLISNCSEKTLLFLHVTLFIFRTKIGNYCEKVLTYRLIPRINYKRMQLLKHLEYMEQFYT